MALKAFHRRQYVLALIPTDFGKSLVQQHSAKWLATWQRCAALVDAPSLKF